MGDQGTNLSTGMQVLIQCLDRDATAASVFFTTVSDGHKEVLEVGDLGVDPKLVRGLPHSRIERILPPSHATPLHRIEKRQDLGLAFTLHRLETRPIIEDYAIHRSGRLGCNCRPIICLTQFFNYDLPHTVYCIGKSTSSHAFRLVDEKDHL